MLREPAPDGAELEMILEPRCALPINVAAPVALPRSSAATLGRGRRVSPMRSGRDPLADAMAREAELGRPMRSPLIVAVCAEVVADNPKVPIVEQIVTCGAAAQNMLNAAHAMGYAGIMLTGANAHDPYVKQALGLKPKDEIIGFLYFGTPDAEARPKKRPAAAEYVREWNGR
jgi:nitroreductase